MPKKVYLSKSLPQKRLNLQRKIKKLSKITKNPLKNQLLVDVSLLFVKDEGTGIQRVVNSILLQMFKTPLEGYEVRPVYCTKKQPYHYVNASFIQKYSEVQEDFPAGDVKVRKGDIFLGLDLNPYFLKFHLDQLLEWKLQKVEIHFVIYDLLPYLHPKWFRKKSVKNYKYWLEIISVYSNSLICISNSVKDEMQTWLMSQGFSKHTPKVSEISLGMGIENIVKDDSWVNTDMFEGLANKKFMLMVGTIEPRKGYDEVIETIQQLWDNGEEMCLVIVGKKGWKTEKLQKLLLQLHQKSANFYWYKNIDDAQLQHLYQKAFGVIVASYAEGYGLPISEAKYFNKPLLVRDIPVFREVLGDYSDVMIYDEDFDIMIKAFYHASWSSRDYVDEIYKKCTWKESLYSLYSQFKVIHK